MTVSNQTVTVGSWSAGPSYEVRIDAAGPSGFFGLGSRNADQSRGDRPGAVSGRDIADVGVGSIPLIVTPTDPTTAWTVYETLRGVWQPSTGDQALTLGDSRSVDRTWYGRTDGLSAEDTSMIEQGIVTCVARYRILDPYSYGAAVTVTTAGTVTSAGTAATDRVTITLHCSGGTPRIANTSTGGWLQWASAASGTRVIDLRAKTVANGGVSAFSELDASQEWFTLAPGANVLTVTGATSIDVTYRPAYA